MFRLAQDVIVPSPVPPISLLLAAFGGHSSGEEPIKTCLKSPVHANIAPFYVMLESGVTSALCPPLSTTYAFRISPLEVAPLRVG